MSPCTLHASGPVPLCLPPGALQRRVPTPSGYTRRNILWAAACLQRRVRPHCCKGHEPLHSMRQRTSAPVSSGVQAAGNCGINSPASRLHCCKGQQPCTLHASGPVPLCLPPGAPKRRLPTPSGYTRLNLLWAAACIQKASAPTLLQRPRAPALYTPADQFPCVCPLALLSDAYLPPAGTRAVTYCGRLLASKG